MTVKEHYESHLAHFYSWMAGDFETQKQSFKTFLNDQGIIPKTNKLALDLGAGHGLQSVPLAELGFHVLAVDFNQQLLVELQKNANGLAVTPLLADFRNLDAFTKDKPELMLCCGDTLSHLDNKMEVAALLTSMAQTLTTNGKLILSFRDYTHELTGPARFIPVKSDDSRILTCILDYSEEFVTVTDLLHEKTSLGWIQKVSSYQKVRIVTKEIVELLQKNSFVIEFNEVVNRLSTIIATKVEK